MWNLGEPAPLWKLLRVEPFFPEPCGTSLVPGFGRLPQTTPKLYSKNPKLFKLLGNKLLPHADETALTCLDLWRVGLFGNHYYFVLARVCFWERVRACRIPIRLSAVQRMLSSSLQQVGVLGIIPLCLCFSCWLCDKNGKLWPYAGHDGGLTENDVDDLFSPRPWTSSDRLFCWGRVVFPYRSQQALWCPSHTATSSNIDSYAWPCGLHLSTKGRRSLGKSFSFLFFSERHESWLVTLWQYDDLPDRCVAIFCHHWAVDGI